MKYVTRGVCAREIEFDIIDGKVKNVTFNGGCDGNQHGISAMVEGQPVELVIERLRGIDCKGRGTSCPDQLSIALQEALKTM